MRPERAAELLPIIEAYSKGQEIEYQRLDGVWVPNEQMGFGGKWNYRVKPAPKLVPWASRDVPMGAIIRSKKGDPDRRGIIMEVNPEGVLSSLRGWITFAKLLEAYEYTKLRVDHDGVVWQPCVKAAP